jgi:HPt (histidine-containing phosphotransfer) domain-containing protein
MLESQSRQQPEAPTLPEIPGFTQLRLDYLKRLSQEVTMLDGALASADFNRIRTSGHNMKGNGSPYGFDPISAFGRALEAHARNGQAAEIRATLIELRNYLSHVKVS